MSEENYRSTQLLSTTINIKPDKLKGNINKTLLYLLKKRYEGMCNKDGYIENNTIELINRSLGNIKVLNNMSYLTFNLTYKASVISPSIGNKIKCIVNSNNKMGLIAYIKQNKDDTIEDSPFIIIIPKEFFEGVNPESIKVNDEINVEVINFRTKYLSKQIQIVSKPI